MVTVFYIAMMFLAFVFQHFVGAVPGFGSQILLLPVIFLCGAATLSVPGMLSLAFVAGLMWDCVHCVTIDGSSDFPFGGTIALYAVIGSLMNGLRPLFFRGLWLVHVLVTGALTSLLVLSEYIIITFRREPFALVWPNEVWTRIGGSGLVAAVLSVPIFLFLTWASRRAGLFTGRRTAN